MDARFPVFEDEFPRNRFGAEECTEFAAVVFGADLKLEELADPAGGGETLQYLVVQRRSPPLHVVLHEAKPFFFDEHDSRQLLGVVVQS